MPPKPPPPCGICAQASKYRCAACPVRYCSVKCYKTHKESCVRAGGKDAPAPSLGGGIETAAATGVSAKTAAATETGTETETATTTAAAAAEAEAGRAAAAETAESSTTTRTEETPLRPLTSLRWPPEPDASIFMDPLKRDDPKPLRHAELERIATSRDLRALLAHPTLPRVLAAIDELPSTHARHAALARVLGVDAQSLAKPAAAALMAGRSSPPPLDELLGGIVNANSGARDDWGADGWWLGRENKVWVGPEERRLMRVWAGVVVDAIDGEQEASWGEGNLEWEV